jgi:aspartate/methionine/tyrosine aminotransferase
MKFRKEIGESLTLKFAEAANQRSVAGKDIISLGLGEPDFDVPHELISATIKVLQSGKSGYSSPMGLPALRTRIAEKLSNENLIPAKSENILITPGAKQALQMGLFALLEPGDEVIVINPSFVSFIPQIYLAEPRTKVKIIDTNKTDFSMPIEEIKKEVTSKTKAILINSPNNPAGYTSSKSELTALYELALQYDFYIFSDEIYEKLLFPGSKHFSIGSLEQQIDRVFTINGYSKSHAMTGWRLGYLCFPKKFGDRLLKLQQHINTNTCTFIQKAVLDAFDMDMSFLENYNQKLAQRSKIVYECFNNLKGTRLVPPSAGFFAFVDISALKVDSNTFCGDLVEQTGVATTPGLAFGEHWDDHFRLSYAVNEKILREGLLRIQDYINKYYSL